ncbi:TIGR01244 family sulfur transferase [Pukyongiella litopenaei]|uniref:TIGR01244 family phosphatase n=1 Tax=Pukyongiella litopenaei TaxID=2605946 RepID=A0A2S0MV12_9RHOB|nr:TIGR01244 family sulfur transferase [Pukyongiella litopenaei]AVO39561.1 TIGR01244 family phosphatase [Pukyongiella litopenaei]
MDIRIVTPRYHVSPQITPQDIPDLAAQGFTLIICNRPDAENPPELHAAQVRAAAEAAGLGFAQLDLTQQTMTPDNIARQTALVDEAEGPVLAYCASGTRCTIAWALGQAGRMPVDDILAATQAAGYALDHLRPTLEALARR